MENFFQLKLYPDSVLREQSLPVEEVNGDIYNLIQVMSRIMYSYKGIGLAAPQVGVSKRIIIADIGQGLIPLLNPEILQLEGQDYQKEGCLSLPDVQVDIARHHSILVRGVDSQGEETNLELSGLTARVIQHEIDHLNGILIIDYASVVDKYLLTQRFQGA